MQKVGELSKSHGEKLVMNGCCGRLSLTGSRSPCDVTEGKGGSEGMREGGHLDQALLWESDPQTRILFPLGRRGVPQRARRQIKTHLNGAVGDIFFFNLHSVFVKFIYKQITSLFTVHEHRVYSFCDVNNNPPVGVRGKKPVLKYLQTLK